MSDIAIILTAGTALVAVIVGPVVSVYIARRQIRASVVSANRQAWINNLRDAIADYLAKQEMVRNLNVHGYADESSFPRIEETVRLANRIELLINPKEEDHVELAHLICQMANTMNQQNEKNKDFDVDMHRKRIVELSQAILKREWERVKSGD